ncbi:FAD dependent oxidoreductase [Aspergillus crustosus]
MSSGDSLTQSILILGAGCFGLSTAYHLASQGYSKITVLEKDSEVPSRFSAANDLNKVIRAEYADAFYTDLALEAIQKWQTDPLYSPHYHQTGFLNVTSKAATDGTKHVVEKYYTSVRNHAGFSGQVQRVEGVSEVKELVPAFDGPVEGWSGYYNKLAGYSHSANALKFVYEACVELGVTFHLGESDGEVDSLLYASARHGTTCIGAKTRGGKVHLAGKTILALGADVPNLIPNIGKQVTGRCWGIAHIQLTPEEAKELEGIPVTNVRDLAFFFEPDRETLKLKFCHMGGAFTNYARSKDGLSLPFPSIAESQFIPANDERCIRQLLKEIWPRFADRPLIDKHLCWVADTDDSDFIIDFVPGTDSSLIVLSGDSGHGFKMMPIFGSFVQTLLDERKQSQSKWQWKTSKPKAASAWRSGDSQELAGLPRAKL